jgi:hypothetical protein
MMLRQLLMLLYMYLCDGDDCSVTGIRISHGVGLCKSCC